MKTAVLISTESYFLFSAGFCSVLFSSSFSSCDPLLSAEENFGFNIALCAQIAGRSDLDVTVVFVVVTALKLYPSLGQHVPGLMRAS